ncbi:hypothetical protein [Dehalobacter sp. TeCB1]|uniref:hypothetical protein n=1 Tax=Dehalobacter sp. TeCB1 TaxID=1843715 RepID=UPI00083A079D|nr:hypothetical protein [Dehalobacter sp. TeCB1]OCZ54295.1 hypothetical protein A7D23_05875 [Dehalobacter sp. TeCB1]
MESQTYSIYVDKRPINTAFLINPLIEDLESICKIVNRNISMWGGRYNPIIFTDGKDIENHWWTFLYDVDPDIIKSFVVIEDSLLNKIEEKLSPLLIEVPLRIDESKILNVNSNYDGIAIYPTLKNVVKVSNSFRFKPSFVYFDVTNIEDDLLKAFITVNFGTYPKNELMNNFFKENNIEEYVITDRNSFDDALIKVSTFEKKVYPIQVCTLPNYFDDTEYDKSGEVFTVIIGNKLDEVVYSWNRIFSIPQWKRIDLNHIWIPLELLNYSSTKDAIGKWISNMHSLNGKHENEITFVSFSISEDELKDITRDLLNSKYIMVNYETSNELRKTNFRKKIVPNISEDMDLYRGIGNKEQIVLKNPDPGSEYFRHGYWMSDIYINHINNHRDNLWWQLPSKNVLAHNIFHKPSRIKKDGFFSVLSNQANPNLKISLYDDASIIRMLLWRQNSPYFTADPRTKLFSMKRPKFQESDKGRYLTGFSDLFGGLFNAYFYLKERYWRRIFDQLCYRNPEKVKINESTILSKIQKKLDKYGFKDPDWWVSQIYQYAKELSINSKEQPFDLFENIAQEELKEYNSKNNDEVEYHREELEEELSELIALDIVKIGLRQHCTLCGMANWFNIDEARQNLQCSGCGNAFTIKPQSKWYYKLNSLIQSGCSEHGLIPVILTLGQLQSDSRTSFFFCNSLEILLEEDETSLGDIDIICIQDGKLIIGEVKQSIKHFNKTEFAKMATMAKKLKPDVVIFSSLDNKPNQFVIENIKDLSKELSDYYIEVRWYPFHQFIFEASPL